MGADIKALRNRIKSVDSTLHLTKAMGLVASSKLRRAMEGMKNGREYERAIRGIIEPLISSPECKKSPYMRQVHTEGDGEKERLCLVVIAGDRGLAGGYNANIFRALRDLEVVNVIPIGKRACERFKAQNMSSERIGYDEALGIADELCRDFADGKYDRVCILCTKYVSMMSQEARLVQMFPLVSERETKAASVVFEPDEKTVLDAVVPEYAAGMILSAAREAFACEIAARRNAMDSAGKNAQSMIDSLSLEYNRARQGAITQEITEIVAGSGS